MSGRRRGAFSAKRAAGVAALGLALVVTVVAVAANTRTGPGHRPSPPRRSAGVTTTGFASPTSWADAKVSCDAELPRLRAETAHPVTLVASFPTDGFYGWTWSENDGAVDRPSDRTSAKVCLFRGQFKVGPSSDASGAELSTPTRYLPLCAIVQEPNGLGVGQCEASWPHKALHLVNIHPYVGHPVVHWAPW